MSNIAAMPVYGKNIKKKLILRNQWTNCLETWYVVMGYWGPSVVYSNDDWLDLDQIFIKVKFDRKCFCMGEVKIVNILEIIVSCEL